VRRAITGLRAWLVQRASAVYMLFFLIFMLGHFLFAPFSSYLSWRNWVLSPAVSVAFSIFFAALLAHVWVGIRDVILDYVHPIAVRVVVLALLVLALSAAGLWVIRILWLGQD
jgi:succinate dehydrogenase / fumarate reductase membrane anchor subunit